MFIFATNVIIRCTDWDRFTETCHLIVLHFGNSVNGGATNNTPEEYNDCEKCESHSINLGRDDCGKDNHQTSRRYHKPTHVALHRGD